MTTAAPRIIVVDENLNKRLATELSYRGRGATSVSALGLRGSQILSFSSSSMLSSMIGFSSQLMMRCLRTTRSRSWPSAARSPSSTPTGCQPGRLKPGDEKSFIDGRMQSTFSSQEPPDGTGSTAITHGACGVVGNLSGRFSQNRDH